MKEATWFGAPFGRGFARIQRNLEDDGIRCVWRDAEKGITPGVAALVLIAPEGTRGADLRRAAEATGRKVVMVDHSHYGLTRRALVAAGVIVDTEEAGVKAVSGNGHIANGGQAALRANASPSTSYGELAAIHVDKLDDVEEVEREVRAFVRRLRPAYRAYAVDEVERMKRADLARGAAREALARVREVGDDAMIALVEGLTEAERDAFLALVKP